MIVNIETFNSYSGNYEDNSSAILLKETFLLSAQQIVTGYLGYDPIEQECSDVFLSGNGTKKLYLPSNNITQLLSIKINNLDVNVEDFKPKDDYIICKNISDLFPVGNENIKVDYIGGWPIQDMPSVIVLSILRIATLMLSETDGNIGLTGKSFADNSRTFINYSNYKKYLQPLDSLRIIRF